MDFVSQVGKLLLAGAFGSIIGVERELGGKAGGLRTNVVICVASALFTILSIDAFREGGGADRVGRRLPRRGRTHPRLVGSVVKR